jgi:hypothetical protein
MSDVYDENWLRFILISKPEQSGKTFIMIRQIINEITEHEDDIKIINIILCDNNLLLTKQTSNRVKTELKGILVEDEIYIEFSSHSRTEYHDVKSVFYAIVAENIRNIICCTNGRRISDIDQIITKINKSVNNAGKYYFNIWLDEADKYIKFIDETLKPIVNENINVEVKLITATPEILFSHYKYINVFPIETPTEENYHGWRDNNIVILPEMGYLDFIENVLRNVASECIIPGTKWFIPGQTNKQSHNSIKNLCIQIGMAVIIVNGDGINLYIPNNSEELETHNYYKKDEEFNTKIIRIYREQELHLYPLVITGNICIGRGVTIMNNDFMITHSILSWYSKKSEGSQLAGRVKGNIKHLPNYSKDRVPIIFTTSKFNDNAIEWENKSIELSKLAFKKEQDGLLTIVNYSEFKTCDKEYEYIKIEYLLNTFEDAKKELTRRQREMDTKVKISKKSVIHECEGYFVTSKLLTAGETVDSLTKDHRLTKEKADRIAASRCISSTDKGSRYLILPIYENMDTPPNEVKYEVRYIRFKK